MPINHTTPTAADPARSVVRALAALREAAEHLEEASAASEQPNLSIVSAHAHVAAARAALRPHGIGAERPASEQRAA